MTKLLVLAALLAGGCGGSATCTITVETITPETMGGQSTLTGEFSQGQPIMVLSFDNSPNFIGCTVQSDGATATCNVGGLVGLGTYVLSFDVSCNNNAEDGTVDNEVGDSFQVLY